MMQTTEIKFMLNQGWGDFRELWLVKYELGKAYNGYLKGGDIVWQEIKEGSIDYTDIKGKKIIPFLKILRNFDVQGLVDVLTQKGTLPPTKQIELDAELKATKFHLSDMRALVFKDKQNE